MASNTSANNNNTNPLRLSGLKKLFRNSGKKKAYSVPVFEDEDNISMPLPPSDSRTITFTIPGKGTYTYTGTLLNQLGALNEIPHGTGALTYPNGTCYEGDFENGKRHGFGKLRYNGESGSWLAIGEWVDNKPSQESRWKMSLENKWDYWGYIELNPKADLDLLDITDFFMSQEGELYTKSHETYIGSFENNKRSGYGVQVFSNMNRYFGGWKNGVFHGYGTFMYYDGTIFQGKFKSGQRKGKGTMYWPNGDALFGRWNGPDVEKATFTKGTCVNCFATALYQIKSAATNELNVRVGNGVASKPMETYGLNNENVTTAKPSYSLKWKQFKIVYEHLKKHEIENYIEPLSYLLKHTDNFKEFVEQMLSSTSEDSYINFAFNFFQSTFQGNYHTASRTQGNKKAAVLYHAIEDVQSFIEFLKEEVWSFFEVAFELMSEKSATAERRPRKSIFRKSKDKNESMGTEQTISDGQIKQIHETCVALFEPIIPEYVHKKLGDTLFSLYEKTYQEEDLLLNHKLDSLAFCHPEHLGVDAIFLPVDTAEEPFKKSIVLLEGLNQNKCKTFFEKVHTLKVFRNSLLTEIKQNRAANRKKKRESQGINDAQEDEKDQKWEPGADDAAPILTFVFIKASIRNHKAQFQYINDWKSNDVLLSPVSHVLAFYEGFLSFILDLDPSLKSKDGVFISNYTLYKDLEHGLEKELADADIYSFTWLPSLLMFLSLEIGRRSGEALTKLQIPNEGHMKLATNLKQNIEIVQKVLSYSKLLGFTVCLEDDNVVIYFESVYPTVVYSNISIHMTKFIHFELDRR